MNESLYNLAEITRGCSTENDEKNNKYMEGMKEMYILDYNSLIPYNEHPTLTNTIDTKTIGNKVYVNLSQKYKQGTIRKKDIILPISNMDYEPRFVNWSSNETLDYIYHTKLIVIRPNINLVVPEYLFYKLNSKHIRDYWFEHSLETSTRHRLICKTVQDLRIDIPSLEEQQKIVEKLKIINTEREEIQNHFNQTILD